jgi:hypothetical protein
VLPDRPFELDSTPEGRCSADDAAARGSALPERLRLERSTISRNLAPMQKKGWVAVAETSATGRAMSVTITDTGLAAFTSAGTAWHRAQANAATMLAPDAGPMLDQCLGLNDATPTGGSDWGIPVGSDAASQGGPTPGGLLGASRQSGAIEPALACPLGRRPYQAVRRTLSSGGQVTESCSRE